MGLVLAILAIGATAALVPSSADAARAPTGIRAVTVPESIPGYHVDVVVPQLEAATASAEMANAALRTDAEGLVDRWHPWLAHHRSCPRRSSRRCGPGSFAVRAPAGLTSTSPRLVNALLEVVASCPGCATAHVWSSDAVLVGTETPVNLFDLIFGGHPRALRSVADEIRAEVRWDEGANTCVGSLQADLSGSHEWRHIARWMLLMRRHRAVAMTRNGLVVGFDAGDYSRRACGASTFLVPYQSFAGLLSGEGQVLVDSFVYGTYNPPLRYELPVRVCPSTYGSSGTTTRLSRTLDVVAPAWFKGTMALYTGTQGWYYVAAPNGWRCTAAFGADGSSLFAIYPKVERAPGDDWQHRSARQGIYLYTEPACVSCLLSLACPYFASARRAWSREYGEPDQVAVCAPPRPRRERVHALSTTIVRVIDAPGVVGNLWPSGGSDTAVGDVGYFPYGPNDFGPYGSYLEDCTLPGGDGSLCDASLGWFAASYGRPGT